jgi:hypothetical protein
MDWKILVNDEFKYVEVITGGIADKDESLNMAKAITHVMKTNRITKALIDHRNLESVTGNIFDIYDRPGLFRIIGIILRIKIAEIIKSEHLEHFKFLETVCVNQGYRMAAFQEKEKALAWLLE